RLDAPKGSYVLFATAPGDVAVDGDGDNSPFTRALAHYFATPGLTIEQIIKRVGRTVSKATADRQRPWLSSSVYEDYFPAGHGTTKSTTTIPNRTTGSLSVTNSLELESNQPINLATAQSRTDLFRDCPSCPEMVRIPAGNFRMGSLNTRFSDRNQRPSRDIIIPKPFAVGRFEVTFDEWESCYSDGGCAAYKPPDEGWGRGKRPVIRINWKDAITYISWLKHRTGEPYRLLSEAEWEYVARSGSTTLFSTGDTITTYQANFDGRRSYNDGPKGILRAQTQLVGSYQPNAFGLYDVHGNVWEWVADCWANSYEGAPIDGSARLVPNRGTRCTRRVARGGSFNRGARFARSSARYYLSASLRSREMGMRVARNLDE
ncbi:MAG: SUMF1/EgtB/PvdO family nonheme iron enzyme, partial [Hyphomicrobiaceae bacterium]